MYEKKRAKQEALWGPGGAFVVYTKRGGRESNRKYRKDQVEKRMRSMLTGRTSYQDGTVKDVPMARVSSGFASLPLEAQSLERKGISPDVGFRTVMNSPMTLAGLIRSGLKGKMPYADAEGNILSDAPPAQNALGQTMGEVMFINPELDPETRRETLAHEKEHVRQGGRMSVLYPLLNALETGQLFARGKDPYEENRFEKAAERAREASKPQYQEGSLAPLTDALALPPSLPPSLTPAAAPGILPGEGPIPSGPAPSKYGGLSPRAYALANPIYGPGGRRINQQKLRAQGLVPGSPGWLAAGKPRIQPAAAGAAPPGPATPPAVAPGPAPAPTQPQYAEGTLSRITDTLADLPYQLRYGVGAEEKDLATALGKAPGYEAPGAASKDWPAARRTMSAYLASQKWGGNTARAAQQIRNALKFWADPGFRYSQPGQEASGWDTRMDEIVARAAEEAARGGGGGTGW